jgi:tRNA-specific 2-thiouridylase
LFPVGGISKPEVREHARRIGLAVAERSDSQDLCFLAGQDYRNFLARHVPEVVRSGPIVQRDGKVIGEHQGLAFYTIGQRKGLRIAAPEPLYVVEKDLDSNVLVVGAAAELGHTGLRAQGINWISNEPPASPFSAQVKIRYRAALVPATVIPEGQEAVRIIFETPLRDITAGQRVVIYNGDVVVGGGMIQSSFKPYGE